MPSVNLTWTESESDATLVNQYLIYRRVQGGTFALLTTLDIERDAYGARTTDLAYSDTTIESGITYEYQVVGRAIEGPDSDPSNIVSLPTFYILQEDGFRILLEDGSSAILTEEAP